MKHSSTYRVPYADTDQMGVVYYGNYFTYFERSRTEMLRSIGYPYSEMEKKGLFLMVSEAKCKYTGSATYDDLITFESWVSEVRRATLTIMTEVKLDGKLLATGYVTLAATNAEHKLTRLPQFFLDAIANLINLDTHAEKA